VTADEPQISRRVIREVMKSKRAQRLEDWAIPVADSEEDSIGILLRRSVICAPLLDSQGVALGAVQLDTADPQRRFRQEDLELFATVSVPAGIAVDNAQLHAQAARRKELEEDLRLARVVQQSFLPQRFPEMEEYEFFHFYRPMIEVGGDYYDYVEMEDGRLALVVADVVGHGVQAAMMMARLSAEAKFCLARESQPGKAVAMLNDRLVALLTDPDEFRFVTLVLVVLDPQQHQATIVLAGHPAPIWRHSDATIEMPGYAQRGGVTGLEPGAVFDQVTIPLAPGDSLTMYTDGVPDARDAGDRTFGTAGILKHLQGQEVPDGLTTLGQAIVTSVRDHIGMRDQADDMCMVLLRRKPRGGKGSA
jgi:serine phosphatase RsbU (regulator of sigma subunit)